MPIDLRRGIWAEPQYKVLYDHPMVHRFVHLAIAMHHLIDEIRGIHFQAGYRAQDRFQIARRMQVSAFHIQDRDLIDILQQLQLRRDAINDIFETTIADMLSMASVFRLTAPR